MENPELIAKFRDARVALDLLEDLLIEDLLAVENLIDLGDVAGAKQKLQEMRTALESEGSN